MDAKTQLDRLTELTILHRAQLHELADQLPGLREEIVAEFERRMDEAEPRFREELEAFAEAKTAEEVAQQARHLKAEIDAIAEAAQANITEKIALLLAEKAAIREMVQKAKADVAGTLKAVPEDIKQIVGLHADEIRAETKAQLDTHFATPRALNPRGIWKPTEIYDRLDLISHDGSSYIANERIRGVPPSASRPEYTQVARRGAAGGLSPTTLAGLVGGSSDGQILIGNDGDYVRANLTAGYGVNITSGPGFIEIETAGFVIFEGTWNASTNTPALASGVGTSGHYYVVSTGGTTNLDGITDWQPGDWAIFHGAAWQKVDNSEIITSVNGQTGVVVLTKSDVGLGNVTNDAQLKIASNLSDLNNATTARTNIGLGNVDNTSDANKPVSTATQTALNLKANLASPTFTGTPAAPTATAGNSSTQLATTAFVTTADNLKANLASPTFTGTVSGITKTMVGLANVDNTSDADKPISTAAAESFAARAPRGQVISDGATSNRAQVQTPGARGNLAGVPVATWRGFVPVPASNPAAAIFIGTLSDNGTQSFGRSHSLVLAVNNAGVLEIWAYGTAGFSDRRGFTWTGFRAAYSGLTVLLEVQFTRGTTSPIVRVNDIDISANFSSPSAGDAPDWLDAALLPAVHITGGSWPAGPAPLGGWILGSLTDAERTAWTATGQPPGWVAAGGSAVAIISPTVLNGGFEDAGAGSPDNFAIWGEAAASSGTQSRDTTDPRTGVACLRYERIGGSGVSGFGKVDSQAILEAGALYEVRFWWKDTVASPVNWLDVIIGNNSGIVRPPSAPTAIWSEVVVRGQATGQFLSFGRNPGVVVTNTDLRIDDVTVRRLGALSLPDIQPGGAIGDSTLIATNPARLVGMTPISDKLTSGFSVAYDYTGSSIQILGGAVIGGRKCRLVSVSGRSSASVNLSLGTSTGGTQLVNAQAVNGDFDIATFASRIIAANSSLWLTFSGNTSGLITLQYAPIATA